MNSHLTCVAGLLQFASISNTFVASRLLDSSDIQLYLSHNPVELTNRSKRQCECNGCRNGCSNSYSNTRGGCDDCDGICVQSICITIKRQCSNPCGYRGQSCCDRPQQPCPVCTASPVTSMPRRPPPPPPRPIIRPRICCLCCMPICHPRCVGFGGCGCPMPYNHLG
ncbi:hypothetical protein Q1695_000253 [Nippostrongylus brasiliensis]|nr:hypothetical protein Q1695_000253 [Nippostrongylus brasiliensis]